MYQRAFHRETFFRNLKHNKVKSSVSKVVVCDKMLLDHRHFDSSLPYEITTAASDRQTDTLASVKTLNSCISGFYKRPSKRLRIVFFKV